MKDALYPRPYDAIYTRVSTFEQKHDPQLRELRAWSKANRCRFREFLDTLSGTKFTRTGLDALLAEVRAGQVKRVIVWKLDRLGRSLRHVLQIIDELTAHKCALVCTTQGIDTSANNPGSRFYLQILGAVAEFERNLIAERTRAGLAVARANGKQIGRPQEVQGKAAAVRRMLKQGKSMAEIAAVLKIGIGSVHRLSKKKI